VAGLKQVEFEPAPLERFRPLLGERFAEMERAAALGGAGREHVRESYLAIDRLREYVELLESLLRGRP
jgi:hypothetical protein